MGFDQIYWAEVLGELGPLGTENWALRIPTDDQHPPHFQYPLVMTNIAMVEPCPIEIDGLPINSMVDLSMATLNIQRVGVPENSSLHIRPLSKGVVFWTD